MNYLIKTVLTSLFFLIISCTHAQAYYWGLTSKGGENNTGTIFFTYGPGDEQQIVHSFSYGSGDSPIGSLILASNDHLYGTTAGGNSDYGVIFQFDRDILQYQKMFEFNGGTDGFHPTGHLVNHSNGKIYGMTRNAGEDQAGVIFEYVPGESTISIKKYFRGYDGANPEGGLAVGSNGLLYGLTSYGGNYNAGVLFVFDPESEEYEVLYDFVPVNGMIPVCTLLQASNGKLYGVTPKGGQFNSGVLFEYDITSETYTKLIEFDGQNAGSEPLGSLVEASNGLLYGMSKRNEIAESESYGVIYSYDIVSFQINKLHVFDDENGAYPTGSLIEADEYKLIGVTDYGGINDDGVRFEFDIIENSFTKLLDFNGDNGRLPIYSNLIKVYSVGIEESELDNIITVSPNPANSHITIQINTDFKNIEYTLSSMKGDLVEHNKMSSGKLTTINTSSVIAGIYLLKIKLDDKIFVKKILIK